MTKWRADKGWTGKWGVPALLEQPVTERERGAIVAMSMDGFTPRALNGIFTTSDSVGHAVRAYAKHAPAALAKLREIGTRAVLPCDDEYPPLLREIVAPPLLLYVRGERIDTSAPSVGIVGARACTSGAARFSYRIGEAIASAGFNVVSGLAKGIDSAAHHGALEGGKTIGVLGTGVDVCYPTSHHELMTRVAERGTLVSEFPPGTGPREWHFPARNRIIAGSCFALVVVEAGLRSGALITATFAEDGGRQVFACITGPENPAGEGLRELIKDGAHLVIDADTLVDDLIELAEIQGYARPGEVRPGKNERPLELEGDQRLVYDAVTEQTTAEDIADVTELEVSRISIALSELELTGTLACEFGRWRRVT